MQLKRDSVFAGQKGDLVDIVQEANLPIFILITQLFLSCTIKFTGLLVIVYFKLLLRERKNLGLKPQKVLFL